MRRRLRSALPWGAGLLALTAIYVVACVPRYRGDGAFRDNGVLVLMGRRFEVDLGPIDMAKPNARNFTLAGLPAHQYVVGFEFPNEQIAAHDRGRACMTTDLAVVVHEVGGRELVAEQGPLANWTWSSDFVYRMALSNEYSPHKGSRTTPQGTFFNAVRGRTYSVLVRVHASSPLDDCRHARLVVHSN